MSLIETYNNTDNTHRQEMFYEYLQKSGLKESSCKQYAYTHPKNEIILNAVYEVSKKLNLFEVVDLLQVQSVYGKVNDTEENRNINHALSVTISNYKKFLDYLETDVVENDTLTTASNDDNDANSAPKLLVSNSSYSTFARKVMRHLYENVDGLKALEPYAEYSDGQWMNDNAKMVKLTSEEIGVSMSAVFIQCTPKELPNRAHQVYDEPYDFKGENVYLRSAWRLSETSRPAVLPLGKLINVAYQKRFTIRQNGNTLEFWEGKPDEIIGHVDDHYNNKPSIWVYSPGEGARKWQECQDEKLMLLGWDDMGDFFEYDTRQDVVDRLREVYGNTENAYTNDSLAIWQFCREMRPGDIIYVKRGLTLIVGRGIVKGGYIYNGERYEYKNSREVEWTHVGEWEYPKKLPMKTLTRINDYTEMVERLEGLFNPVDTVEQIPFSMSSFISTIQRTGLLYEDKLIQRYACSLMTKPFVILSGLAGSGKTQLALAFARAMSENVEQQLCVVPVGADWTNREPLLGYPNALKQGEYMQPESGALQIMMRAQRNPQKPYFLVLDEMNLSYVERYFADFLSALESNQKIPLWEKPEECDSEVDASIALPKNLFIIGTINVDETTYMFSPKVLDRANVIEFKISETEMEQFLGQDMNIDVHAADGACASMGQDFVTKATSKETDNSELAQKTLLEFFKVLKKVNAEFGYRSATEIYRFIANAKACAESMTEDEILDAAIVQKLLPKLHGSRKKLEPALKALWGLCMMDDHKTEAITRENAEQYARFKEAADKIQRMMQTALDNGFTSFAEA